MSICSVEISNSRDIEIDMCNTVCNCICKMQPLTTKLGMQTPVSGQADLSGRGCGSSTRFRALQIKFEDTSRDGVTCLKVTGPISWALGEK